MKTIRDFLRKHALLLLAALVVLSVPAGVALGKYVKNVEVTKTLNLNVSMVTVEYTIDKNKMWKAISRLPKGSTTLKFVKGNDEALKGLEELSPSGIQDDSLNSGEIGVYQSTDGTTIYIAPMDGSRNVMYAPKDSRWLLCGSYLGLSNLLQTISFDNLDTSRVTDMASMFMNCYALTSLNLDGLDTSNVTRMASMFANCKALTSLDLSKLDTSNVTTMASMFSHCYALTSLDLSSLNTSKVTTMNSMFAYCYALTSLDLSNLNTSNVAFTVDRNGNKYGGMNYMFYRCESLTSLDLSSFNTSKVTGMTDMFWGCEKLKTIYVGDGFVIDQVDQVTEPADSVFNGCKMLKGENGTTYAASQNSSLDYARIDRPSQPGYFSSKNANNTTNTVTFSDGTNGMIIS